MVLVVVGGRYFLLKVLSCNGPGPYLNVTNSNPGGVTCDAPCPHTERTNHIAHSHGERPPVELVREGQQVARAHVPRFGQQITPMAGVVARAAQQSPALLVA